MAKNTRTAHPRPASSRTGAVDPCVTKIEALWDAAGDSVEGLSKSLRLLVFYVRTSDGVPERYNKTVRTKIARLESMLEGMSLEDVTFAIPAIKYARRQLRTYVVYGTRFSAAVSSSDKAKAERIGKPVKLSIPGAFDFESPSPDRHDQFDGFSAGALDDEEFG